MHLKIGIVGITHTCIQHKELRRTLLNHMLYLKKTAVPMTCVYIDKKGKRLQQSEIVQNLKHEVIVQKIKLQDFAEIKTVTSIL